MKGNFNFLRFTPQKTIIYIIFILALLLGFFSRQYFMMRHFTHCDDIGLAITMMSYDNIIMRFLSFHGWTYAPLQYIFETPLISLAGSYDSYIILGRIPSFVIGLLNVFLCHYLLKRITDKVIVVLLGDVLFLLSWENIIYGSQMEPYVIAIMFILLHFVLMVYWGKEITNLRKLCIYTILVTLLSCYAHYQLFLFVFAFYSALICFNLINKNVAQLKVIFKMAIITVLLCLPLVVMLVKLGLLGKGLNWNTGVNNEFLFDISSHNGFIDIFLYIVKFFAVNFFLVVKYFFTSDVFVISNAITYIIIIMSLWGLYYVNRNKRGIYLLSALYIDIILIIYVFLILNGSLTLGPSRHSLVLFPIVLLLSTIGVINLLAKQRLNRIIYAGVLIVVIADVFSFCFVLPEEMTSRKNKISEDKVQTIAQRYNADVVLGVDALQYDLQLMNIDNYIDKSVFLQYGLLMNEKQRPHSGIIVILANNKFNQFKFEEIKKTDLISSNKDIYDFDISWNDLQLLEKEESITNREIEYASKYFDNQSNGLCVYVFHNLK